MTEEEIRKELEDDGQVHYHAWTFTKTAMSCGDFDCCFDMYKDIDETIEAIKLKCNNDLSKVYCDA